MQKLIFYTKLGHRDCDEAYKLLMNVSFMLPLEIDIVDVSLAHNYDYKEMYEHRIPVVVKPETSDELSWPFTEGDIETYLT